ncbi:AraC-like DNA-binding protein [Catenuloplanes nepalensis]|uniref:AraC-like DNA-binding protein n=1 Tax=Catenuloplanes nepalensis TaxID=587533 RepID=A0ABT9MP32_9ACTN|nr:AraC family transcriptional regulator [Catenuloplanes nepalensis]MDP9793153.1 AraC-like DNA-binding protein [Catenuloplanes nepalensis]
MARSPDGTGHGVESDGSPFDRAAIPPAVLAGVLDVGRREGLSVSSWFAGTGLDPVLLYAPGARVSLQQGRTILRRAIDALPGRPLGFEVGERDTLLSFGFLGIAMRASATAGEAFALAEELHLSAGSLLDVEREDLGAEIGIRFRERWPDPGILVFLCEEALASTTIIIRSMLAETPWTPVRVDLSYPPPPHASRYRRVFGCPIVFSADANRLVIPKELLDRPLPTQHKPTRQMAMEICRQYLSPGEAPPDIVTSVEALVGGNLRHPLTMSDIADRLFITERTLRRRLADSGERFSTIRDRVRERRATSLLWDTTMPVGDVAAEIGFNDGREFRRAYVRWRGLTPTEARRSRR